MQKRIILSLLLLTAIVGRADIVVTQGELYDGKDMTHYINNPGFDDDDVLSEIPEGWTVEHYGDGHITRGPLGQASMDLMMSSLGWINYCFESWHCHKWDVWQELENLPVGLYELQVQGFVRCEVSGYNRGDDIEPNFPSPASLYMGDAVTQLPNIYSQSAQTLGHSFITVESWTKDIINGVAYPNSMGGASQCFAWGMYKTKVFGFVANRGGKVRIGMKMDVDQNWWCIWDTFKLIWHEPTVDVAKSALEDELQNIDLTQLMGKDVYERGVQVCASAESAVASDDLQTMLAALNDLYAVAEEISASVELFQNLQLAVKDLLYAISESEATSDVKEEASLLADKVGGMIYGRQLSDSDAELLLKLIEDMRIKLTIRRPWTIGSGGDFADVNAAMSDSRVMDGDVLQMLPGTVLTGTQIIKRNITLRGTGYHLDPNNNNSLNTLDSNDACIKGDLQVFGNIYDDGNKVVISELALPDYLNNNNTTVGGKLNIYRGNILVERCYVSGAIWAAYKIDHDDVTIRQSFFNRLTGNNSQRWTIENCIIAISGFNGYGNIDNISNSTIRHNIIFTTFKSEYLADDYSNIRRVTSSNIYDNILCHFDSGNNYLGTYEGIFSSTCSDNTLYNNVMTGTVASGGSGLTEMHSIFDIVTQNNIFIYYSDANFRLKPNSMAKGTAHDGSDCGPWSGPYPYVLGGVSGSDAPADDFQVEPNDLLALKNMYQAWGGENWTTKQWSLESNGKSREDFPGVTFSDDGRVTEIDLSNNGLAGACFDITSPQLSELTSLNLSRNELTGDIGRLVADMAKLQTLDLHQNYLSELSETLPAGCNDINLSCQNLKFGGESLLSDYYHTLQPVVVPVYTQGDMNVQLPSLYTYFKPSKRCIETITLPVERYCYLDDTSDGSMHLSLINPVYTLPQDAVMNLWLCEGPAVSSSYPVRLHYAEGDADMSGYTNIYDVQYTLNYILAPQTVGSFNYSAANTYIDNIINVQDIVKTVNIILNPSTDNLVGNAVVGNASERCEVVGNASERCEVVGNASERCISSEPSDCHARRRDPLMGSSSDGLVFTHNGYVILSSDKSVSAIDITLDGVSTSEVSLLLNHNDYQMIGRDTDSGSRYIIFSPTGKILPTDRENTILRMSGNGQPVAINCSDTEAQPVEIAIGDATTGITTMLSTEQKMPVYDLYGRRTDGLHKGVYIQKTRKTFIKTTN